MHPYTVVVLYPEADEDHPDLERGLTYTAHVKAVDAYEARKAGALQAWRRQPNEDRGKPSDWTVLVVFAGHLTPLSYGWQA